MSTKKRTVRESDSDLLRRHFLQGGVGLAVGLGWIGGRPASAKREIGNLLGTSSFVYVSPLREDGR